MPAGLVEPVRTPAGWACVYLAEAQGIDTDGAKYATICEAHGTIVSERTKRDALASARHPEMFCDGCRGDL